VDAELSNKNRENAMNKVKQITTRTAEQIAEKAADRSLGFGPRSGQVTIDASEVVRVAKRAALIALEDAGFLDQQTAADDKWNDEQARSASARHKSVCKRLGIAY